MSQKRIQQIERKIDRIKRGLLEIGPMRPGLSAAAKKGTSLAVEREPGVRLRSGLR